MGVNTGVKHRELNAIKRLDFWFKSVVIHFRYIVSFNAKNNKTAPSIYCCMQSDWGATFLLPRDNFEHYAGRQDLQMNVHMIFWYRNQFATVYKGNMIKNLIMDCRSYTWYRPTETMGGIFVSWQRKEEPCDRVWWNIRPIFLYPKQEVLCTWQMIRT